MNAISVSVVVPSLNQATFLRESIDSILNQDFSPLEVLVMDGGSSDESQEILRGYGSRIRSVSAPDAGQADAINKGFAQASGDVLAWLNADDRYAPGAIRKAVAALVDRPEAPMVYGDAELIDEHGRVLRVFPFSQPFDLWKLVHVADYIMQPTVFMRASAFHAAGGLDATLRFALDWDLWIRLASLGQPTYLRKVLAQTREHAASKTARGGFERFRELQKVLRRHGARPYSSPAAIAYGMDTLRRRWTVLFGPASAADLEEQRGRAWPRVFRPVHALLARAIDWQMSEAQGVYTDGWAGARAHLAVPWGGEGGVLRVCGHGPVAGSTQRIELAARGRSARVVCEGTEAFRVELEIPASRDATRIDLSLASSRTHIFPNDRRRLAFRIDTVSFGPVGR